MPASLPLLRIASLVLSLSGFFATGAAGAKEAPAKSPSADALRRAALDPRIYAMATTAVHCAEASGLPPAKHLGIIDYTRPSNAPRLWVFDQTDGRLLYRERVAHGRGSGDARSVRFGNRPESNLSSLGLFRTLDAYDGKNGYSLNLQGLEPGINDLAFERRIVIHGADYVSDGFVKLLGRVGRSFGCPAVRREIAQPLIDTLKDDQYLFAYYPDARWTKTSAFLGCEAKKQKATVARK